MADQIATLPAVARNDQITSRHGLEGGNPEMSCGTATFF